MTDENDIEKSSNIDVTEKSLFFSVLEKDRVIIGKTEAGAGFVGLIGFGCLFLVSGDWALTTSFRLSFLSVG